MIKIHPLIRSTEWPKLDEIMTDKQAAQGLMKVILSENGCTSLGVGVSWVSPQQHLLMEIRSNQIVSTSFTSTSSIIFPSVLPSGGPCVSYNHNSYTAITILCQQSAYQHQVRYNLNFIITTTIYHKFTLSKLHDFLSASYQM